MIAHSSQRKHPDNVVQFRREQERAPLCAQCGIPMLVVRGEPEIVDVSVMRVTYRCAQCGLVERKNVTTSRAR
jgi:uncharacterized Zn finger protein